VYLLQWIERFADTHRAGVSFRLDHRLHCSSHYQQTCPWRV